MREPIVLGYHAVSAEWDSPLAVSPLRLEQQVRRLMQLGFRPQLFTDAVLRPTHDRTFVITFDDGYRSVLHRAAPMLDSLGVPATLFAPTDWVHDGHRQARWEQMDQWVQPGHEEELELMDWRELGTLADRGWEIGSHACSHPFLTRLSDAALADELSRSKAALEKRLGRPCTSIAYPYGDVDERVVRAAHAAGYSTGVSLIGMREFAERRHSAALQWRRIGVYAADNTLRFNVKLALMAVLSANKDTQSASVPPVLRVAPVGPRSVPRARVAVVVPCFNDGPLAREAVASVIEGEPVELVVIDDASTEPETVAALEVLRERGVTVVRHETNRGLSAARHTGLAATTAPYVFPLDADDLLMPGALTRLADRLDADPSAAASFGDEQEFGTRSWRTSVPASLDAYRVAHRNDYPVSSLFRRTALEAVGAWQDVGGMVGYEDWNLWMTLAERGDRAVHAGPGFVALKRRLHGPRMLGDAAERHRCLYAELKRTHPVLFAQLSLHRRRSQMSRPRQLAYALFFGSRPPLGLRTALWRVRARVLRVLPSSSE